MTPGNAPFGEKVLKDIDALPDDPAFLKRVLGWLAARNLERSLRVTVLEAELERRGGNIPA